MFVTPYTFSQWFSKVVVCCLNSLCVKFFGRCLHCKFDSPIFLQRGKSICVVFCLLSCWSELFIGGCSLKEADSVDSSLFNSLNCNLGLVRLCF